MASMNKAQQKIVLDALDEDEILSEWEHEFIDSIANLPEYCELSKPQNEKLLQIRNKMNGAS